MIGGRNESHPREPGVRVMLVTGIVKLTKGCRFVVSVERRHETFCRVRETINRLGAWLVKCGYPVEGTPGAGVVGQSRPWVQGTEELE